MYWKMYCNSAFFVLENFCTGKIWNFIVNVLVLNSNPCRIPKPTFCSTGTPFWWIHLSFREGYMDFESGVFFKLSLFWFDYLSGLVQGVKMSGLNSVKCLENVCVVNNFLLSVSGKCLDFSRSDNLKNLRHLIGLNFEIFSNHLWHLIGQKCLQSSYSIPLLFKN